MPFEFFFPKTFYFRDDLISEAGNASLVAAAHALRQEFPQSSRGNLYTTYGSVANVLERDDFAVLREALREEIVGYLQQIETREGANCGITDAWVSISAPGNYERMHTHPGSYVSGVYYLQTPDGCGRLTFENMEDNLWYSARSRRENQNAISYEPRARRLVMFNSQVPHHVGQNLSDSERIALSFNVALH